MNICMQRVYNGIHGYIHVIAVDIPRPVLGVILTAETKQVNR